MNSNPLKMALNTSFKLVCMSLVVMAWLAASNCMSLNFEGLSPGNDQSILIPDWEESKNGAGGRSFILNKNTGLYGSPEQTISARYLTERKSPTSSIEGHDSGGTVEGTTSKTRKLSIPEEGGIVRITRPSKIEIRVVREKMRLPNVVYGQENGATEVDEVSSKKNSNLIMIPEEGGAIHIGLPYYITQAQDKKKRIPEDEKTNLIDTLTDFSDRAKPMSGRDNAALENRDLARSTIFEQVPIKETGAPLEQNSASAGAEASTWENIASNVSAASQVTFPGVESVVPGNASLMENVRNENMTQVPSEGTAATHVEQAAPSIYIGSSNYPFFAAIHSQGITGNVSFDDVQCSGGIVNEFAVVTACSCLFADDWPTPPSAVYYVTVGHLKNANIDATPIYKVGSIKYHPSCDKKETGLWKGNIAMLNIPKPGIRFGHNVQPMNLPKLKMWDASDILAKMSDQRRHCRVIGWSRHAPLIDTAIGKLIPLDECANPVCKKHMPCPNRNIVDGFMVEITPNEPSLLAGALLYCSAHVFGIVNTKRQCTTNHVFAVCSPEELLYSRFNFELTPEAQRDMAEYNNTFSKSIEGWETFSYPPTTRAQDFAEIGSASVVSFPFYIPREASWIYTYIFAAGYYVCFLNT